LAQFSTYRAVSDPTKRPPPKKLVSTSGPAFVPHCGNSNGKGPDVIAICPEEVEVLYEGPTPSQEDDEVMVISDTGPPTKNVYRGPGSAAPNESPDKILSEWRDSLAPAGRTLRQIGNLKPGFATSVDQR